VEDGIFETSREIDFTKANELLWFESSIGVKESKERNDLIPKNERKQGLQRSKEWNNLVPKNGRNNPTTKADCSEEEMSL